MSDYQILENQLLTKLNNSELLDFLSKEDPVLVGLFETDYDDWKQEILDQFTSGQDLDFANDVFVHLYRLEFEAWEDTDEKTGASNPQYKHFQHLLELKNESTEEFEFDFDENVRIAKGGDPNIHDANDAFRVVRQAKQRERARRARALQPVTLPPPASAANTVPSAAARKKKSRKKPIRPLLAGLSLAEILQTPVEPPPPPKPPREVLPASAQFPPQEQKLPVEQQKYADQVDPTDDEMKQITDLTMENYNVFAGSPDENDFKSRIFRLYVKRRRNDTQSIDSFVTSQDQQSESFTRTGRDETTSFSPVRKRATFMQEQLFKFRETGDSLQDLDRREQEAADANEAIQKKERQFARISSTIASREEDGYVHFFTPEELNMYQIDATTSLATIVLTLQFWRIVYHSNRFAPKHKAEGQIRIDELLTAMGAMDEEEPFTMPVRPVKSYCGDYYLLPNQRLGTEEECHRKGVYVGNTHGFIQASS
jgi:hypothetical protein